MFSNEMTELYATVIGASKIAQEITMTQGFSDSEGTVCLAASPLHRHASRCHEPGTHVDSPP